MSEDAVLNAFFSEKISEYGGSFEAGVLKIYDENQQVSQTLVLEG